MIKLDLALHINCNKCHAKSNFSTSADNFTSKIRSRRIGDEIEHESILNTTCGNCGAKIRVGIQMYEYPIGYLSYSEVFGYGYNMFELNEQLNADTYTKEFTTLEKISNFNVRYSSCDAGRLWGVGHWCTTCTRKCKIFYN